MRLFRRRFVQPPSTPRSCWVDWPNDPDYTKLGRDGVTGVFFDGRWLAAKGPSASLAYLNAQGNRGLKPGVFLCSQGADDLGAWPSHLTTSPVAWADWANDMIQHKIAPGTGADFPRVDLNCETDDTAWLVSMLYRWRAHQPKRTTSLVVVSHKANVLQGMTGMLSALKIRVKPECFAGAMQRVESAAEIQAWVAAGMPSELLEPMLDGAAVGAWWQGTAFTMGRLA